MPLACAGASQTADGPADRATTRCLCPQINTLSAFAADSVQPVSRGRAAAAARGGRNGRRRRGLHACLSAPLVETRIKPRQTAPQISCLPFAAASWCSVRRAVRPRPPRALPARAPRPPLHGVPKSAFAATPGRLPPRHRSAPACARLTPSSVLSTSTQPAFICLRFSKTSPAQPPAWGWLQGTALRAAAEPGPPAGSCSSSLFSPLTVSVAEIWPAIRRARAPVRAPGSQVGGDLIWGRVIRRCRAAPGGLGRPTGCGQASSGARANPVRIDSWLLGMRTSQATFRPAPSSTARLVSRWN